MRFLSCSCATVAWALAVAAHGGIVLVHEVAIDFSDKLDASAKATWTQHERIGITDKGLGWDGEPTRHIESSVRTKPIALGYNWRPPQQAGVTVTLDADRRTYALNSGQESRPYQGQVYLRYSPDLKHWSTWHVAKLRSTDDKKQIAFSASLGIPRSVRKPYTDLLQTYSRRGDVPAAWDEESAVRWIVRREPDFFAKRLPFVGYIQVMYEGNFGGDRRLRSMHLSIGYAMSGFVQASASRKATGPGFDRHWEYAADGVDATEIINPDP